MAGELKSVLLDWVRPARCATHTCVEDVLLTAANNLDRQHALMYATSWNLGHVSARDGNALCLGERLTTRRGEYGRFTAAHGLQIDRIPGSDDETLLSVLVAELESARPMAIVIDAYWCPWNNAWQTLHSTHCLLAVGLDPRTSEVLCLDPNLTDQLVRLPVEHLRRGASGGYVIAATEVSADPLDWRGVVGDAGRRVLGGGIAGGECIEAIRALAREFGESLDLGRETSGFGDLQYVPLFMILTYVGWARVNFACLLDWLAHAHCAAALSQGAADLREAGQRWLTVKNQLLKQAMFPSSKFEPIAIRVKLEHLADLESRIAHRLVALSERT